MACDKCNGTGKIPLFTGVVDCECVVPPTVGEELAPLMGTVAGLATIESTKWKTPKRYYVTAVEQKPFLKPALEEMKEKLRQSCRDDFHVGRRRRFVLVNRRSLERLVEDFQSLKEKVKALEENRIELL